MSARIFTVSAGLFQPADTAWQPVPDPAPSAGPGLELRKSYLTQGLPVRTLGHLCSQTGIPLLPQQLA